MASRASSHGGKQYTRVEVAAKTLAHQAVLRIEGRIDDIEDTEKFEDLPKDLQLELYELYVELDGRKPGTLATSTRRKYEGIIRRMTKEKEKEDEEAARSREKGARIKARDDAIGSAPIGKRQKKKKGSTVTSPSAENTDRVAALERQNEEARVAKEEARVAEVDRVTNSNVVWHRVDDACHMDDIAALEICCKENDMTSMLINDHGIEDHLAFIIARRATPELVMSAVQRSVISLLDMKKADAEGHTPLMEAAAHGRREMVKRLIDIGSEVNKVDNYGLTAAHLAAMGGWTKTLDSLKTRNADIWMPDHMDRTPDSLIKEYNKKKATEKEATKKKKVGAVVAPITEDEEEEEEADVPAAAAPAAAAPAAAAPAVVIPMEEEDSDNEVMTRQPQREGAPAAAAPMEEEDEDEEEEADVPAAAAPAAAAPAAATPAVAAPVVVVPIEEEEEEDEEEEEEEEAKSDDDEGEEEGEEEEAKSDDDEEDEEDEEEARVDKRKSLTASTPGVEEGEGGLRRSKRAHNSPTRFADDSRMWTPKKNNKRKKQKLDQNKKKKNGTGSFITPEQVTEHAEKGGSQDTIKVLTPTPSSQLTPAVHGKFVFRTNALESLGQSGCNCAAGGLFFTTGGAVRFNKKRDMGLSKSAGVSFINLGELLQNTKGVDGKKKFPFSLEKLNLGPGWDGARDLLKSNSGVFMVRAKTQVETPNGDVLEDEHYIGIDTNRSIICDGMLPEKYRFYQYDDTDLESTETVEMMFKKLFHVSKIHEARIVMVNAKRFSETTHVR
jgi:hypothetical protein